MNTVSAGTVTLVFTDIEGSTQLLQALGERYASALADHHRLLGDAFRAQDGAEQGTAGDGLYYTFPTARGALLAAIEAQRGLAEHTWPGETKVRVRMGIHTGEPRRAETGLVGLDVHRAARIGGVGHGGQILVSQTTHDLVAGDLAGTVDFLDMGEHRLKDMPGPERLYQVVAPGLAAKFPELRTIEAVRGNLPRQLTTFIGRETEVAAARHLLDGAPLLTLTGPGGVGKTRLAVRLATDLVDGFDDGAWLVELGSMTDPSLVTTAVATVLGVTEQPGRPISASIVDHLRRRRLLLVLDNCEHLLAACAELANTILVACPDVRILATSQEPLSIAGEAVLPVPPLTVPPSDPGSTDRDRLLACDAVLLFLERARTANPGFQLTPANGEAVIQICRRLDGIPLALELAAARLRALSAEQIADRLDDRFRLLTGGSRVAIPRHQTLRAAVEWSFELLTEGEAALLRRLSVFAGGLGLEAAEAVGVGDPVDDFDVLDLMARLADKSLVTVDASGPEARYRLSEILRAYSYERLVQAGEAVAARRRHRDWFLELTEGAAKALQRGPEAAAWLDRLELEHDNLRAALEWSESTSDEQRTGLRLATGLWRFWEIRGHAEEGRHWFERLLAATRDDETPLRANALTGAGILAFMQGDFAAAIAFHEQSLELNRRLGNPEGISYAINNVANAALQQGDYARAHALYQQAVVLTGELGDRHGRAFGLMNMADVLEREGDYDAARAHFDESVVAFRALGDRWGEAFALDAFGLIAARQGDVETARSLHVEAAAMSREMNDDRGVARALVNLGDLAARVGERDRALAMYRESLALRLGLGDLPGTAAALEKVAWVVAEDDPEAAARVLGAADAMRETIRARVPPSALGEYERGRQGLEAGLGSEAFDLALKSGRGLSPGAALATLPL
jgi:predicted ATPase/class 3 adenylate cyclase